MIDFITAMMFLCRIIAPLGHLWSRKCRQSSQGLRVQPLLKAQEKAGLILQVFPCPLRSILQMRLYVDLISCDQVLVGINGCILGTVIIFAVLRI